jgi:signal transduction histidine kinase
MTTTGGPGERAELERLRALVEDQETLIALVAHELRAPLASIEGYVEVLLDGELGGLSPEQARALDVVGRNAVRLRALLDELRPGLRSPVPPAAGSRGERVDVGPVVASAVELLRPAARLAGVELTLEPSAAAAVVDGDGPRLEQAVVNVLGNAVKYTPRGGSVVVRVLRERREVVVEVADTGIGIPEDDLGHLTEPWFRASNATASAVAGTGLGLSIVRDVLEEHGGRLGVSSSLGSGTTVRLHFPPAATGRAARAQARHAAALVDAAGSRSRLGGNAVPPLPV